MLTNAALAASTACVFARTSVRYRALDLPVVDTVAILPVRLDNALQAYRRPIADGLYQELRRARPALVTWSADTTLARLQFAGLTDAYARAASLWRREGVPDSAALAALSAATGVRFLVFADLWREEGAGLVSGDKQLDETRVTLTVEVWDGWTGAIVWQAKTVSHDSPIPIGGGQLNASLAEVLQKGMRSAADHFLEKPRGKGRDPNRRG